MKKLIENSAIILLVILTAVICWQGWLIKDCREQLAVHQQTIEKLAAAHADTVSAIYQLMEK